VLFIAVLYGLERQKIPPKLTMDNSHCHGGRTIAMVGDLRWLALEVKYLDRARSFYESFLDLSVRTDGATETTFAAGDTDLILRAPDGVPRGGLHTHYAFSIPADEYDGWYDRLNQRFELVEHSFGQAKSLYLYDPDGNCVELGQRDIEGSGISGIFEIVLEVPDIDRAQSFYEAIGFEVVDWGDGRKRVRLTAGSFDIELWEPHLGLADARGGVHVDFGVTAPEPSTVADRVAESASSVESTENGVRIRDPDGHTLSIVDN